MESKKSMEDVDILKDGSLSLPTLSPSSSYKRDGGRKSKRYPIMFQQLDEGLGSDDGESWSTLFLSVDGFES
ncbi:hypothetical protein TNCV_4789931 [Trichonephila clavipes]|nr:hypothetical protein TNCV_4789931 [Trichonephila clavipes]